MPYYLGDDVEGVHVPPEAGLGLAHVDGQDAVVPDAWGHRRETIGCASGGGQSGRLKVSMQLYPMLGWTATATVRTIYSNSDGRGAGYPNPWRGLHW